MVTRLVLEEESQMLESLLASWRRDGGNEKDPLRYGQWPSPGTSLVCLVVSV